MIGSEGVSAVIAELLEQGIVDEVNGLTASNGPLADGSGADPDPDVQQQLVAQLVVPQLIAPAPPEDMTVVPVDQWPVVAVLIRSTPRIRLIDTDPATPAGLVAGDVYDVDYTGRIFAWVRGDGYTQTKAARDRLMLALRQLLLRHQRSTSARLVAATLTEEFAPVGVDSTLNATIGAGFLQATWRVQETLEMAALDPSPTEVTVTVGRSG